nr:acetylxylan esterase [uncultured Pedobacter sp.]
MKFQKYLLFLILFIVCKASAQTLDETKVPAYTLPPLLKFENGKQVKTVQQWEKRREEILDLLQQEMYGQHPGKPAKMKFEVFDLDNNALNGKAIRKQIKVVFSPKQDSVYMDILMYIPKNSIKPPVILGLNFGGNQEVINDPAVRITHSWVSKKSKGAINNRASETSRGVASGVWPVEKMLEAGFASATIYCGDIDPDYDNVTNAVQSLYPKLQDRKDNFSTIGAWAWGLSRAMDYLEKDNDINSNKVILTGLSRLGKAALWAGATDQRFAIVISTESGKGGDALFQRQFGESVERINKVFPQWFCHNFSKYSNHVAEMPFDQHMVLAMMAPRPFYLGSAEEDLNEDPKGEFLAIKAIEPAYKLYGFKGLPTAKMPPVNQSIYGDRLGFHLREGKHGITAFDWDNYIKFIKSHLY